MTLLNLKYKWPIQKQLLSNDVTAIVDKTQINYFLVNKENGVYSFHENENLWIFSESCTFKLKINNITISMDKGMRVKFSRGIVCTHVNSLEELINKAEGYFLPYVIDEKPQIIKVNMKEKDMFTCLN